MHAGLGGGSVVRFETEQQRGSPAARQQLASSLRCPLARRGERAAKLMVATACVRAQGCLAFLPAPPDGERTRPELDARSSPRRRTASVWLRQVQCVVHRPPRHA